MDSGRRVERSVFFLVSACFRCLFDLTEIASKSRKEDISELQWLRNCTSMHSQRKCFFAAQQPTKYGKTRSRPSRIACCVFHVPSSHYAFFVSERDGAFASFPWIPTTYDARERSGFSDEELSSVSVCESRKSLLDVSKVLQTSQKNTNVSSKEKTMTRSVLATLRAGLRPSGAGKLQLPQVVQTRKFAGYTSMAVTGKDLEKGAEDWVIEETNFNFGRMAPRRFKETEDLARRTKRLLETNPCFMHTRLRDGTCVPYCQPDLHALAEKPYVFHAFYVMDTMVEGGGLFCAVESRVIYATWKLFSTLQLLLHRMSTILHNSWVS
ncbi:unnamed protein product [Amoebophrya sp. A120]|nr:unnamed protein product [Amoebophrya sp. A120]|eukprot:GSA120T00009085001.1